jgi:predicted AAA+ superfamily ATPase
MIKRELYLDQLRTYSDKPFIKVITGMQRSGKSSLLLLLQDELLKRGIRKENIIYLNFASFNFSDIDTADLLYKFVKSKIENKSRYYVLLDEIQEVVSWE